MSDYLFATAGGGTAVFVAPATAPVVAPAATPVVPAAAP